MTAKNMKLRKNRTRPIFEQIGSFSQEQGLVYSKPASPNPALGWKRQGKKKKRAVKIMRFASIYYHDASPDDRRTMPEWEALMRKNREVGLPRAVCEELRAGLHLYVQ